MLITTGLGALCSPVHLKYVIIDSRYAYTGSENLIRPGMEVKATEKRDLESEIITEI